MTRRRLTAGLHNFEPKQQPKNWKNATAQGQSASQAKGKTKASRQSGSEPGEEDKAGDTQWAVPADYQVPLTRMEDDLQEAVKGLIFRGLNCRRRSVKRRAPLQIASCLHRSWTDAALAEVARKRAFAQLHDPSDYLQSHVVARILAAEDVGERLDLIACLETAAEHGHPALAEEACRHLEALKYEPKAGHRADAEFTPPSWSEGFGVGELRLDAEFGIPQFLTLTTRTNSQ